MFYNTPDYTVLSVTTLSIEKKNQCKLLEILFRVLKISEIHISLGK